MLQRFLLDANQGEVIVAVNRLDEFCETATDLFEGSKVRYLIVEGVAVSPIGEPRMTQDIGLIASIQKEDVRRFLEAASQRGFESDIEKESERVERTGTFVLKSGFFRADVIIASIPLEESAFGRSQRVRFMNRMASFASPEELVLFKIIVGRDNDMFDAKSIAIRHKGRLDRAYLEKWAQTITDEAEDMAIWRRPMGALEEEERLEWD